MADRRFAGSTLDWLTFNLFCGLGLVVAYLLLGTTWLIMKAKARCGNGCAADPQGAAGVDGGDRGGQRLDAVGLALRGGTLVYAAQFLLVRAGADPGADPELVDLAPGARPQIMLVPLS